MTAVLSGPAGRTASQASLEQAVKANFLFKFAPFVEWPSAAFSPAGKAFTICVRGSDPFGPMLDDVVRGQKVSSRPVALRRLGAKDNPSGCHILFAGRSPEAGDTAFTELAGQPVLTVSDRKDGPAGAMIQFVMQDGRVRFQIDDGAARTNGLRISSKLLALAVSVERR